MNTRTDLATRVFCSLPPHPLFSPPRTPKRFLGDIIHAGLPPSCIYASSPCIGRTIYRGRERAARFFCREAVNGASAKIGTRVDCKTNFPFIRPSCARRRGTVASCLLSYGAEMDYNFLSTGSNVQRSKKWLVRGLVKFVTAVARLVCLDLLG